VFLGCLGRSLECKDVEVEEGFTGTMYAHVDFNKEIEMPILTVDDDDMNYDKDSEGGIDTGILTLPLYEFEKGVAIRGNPGLIILPTWTFYHKEE
jgi:hypothetical protein